MNTKRRKPLTKEQKAGLIELAIRIAILVFGVITGKQIQ